MGWDRPDVLVVTGDAYVDHPSFGAAVVGRVLAAAGWRVAICDAVGRDEGARIAAFGVPRLFYGVTSGNVDSMLMRYTAFGKIRNDDPYLPQSLAGMRPERAVIHYCNLIKQISKDVPIVVGGIEASMRRLAHFDFTSGKIRRSILLDSRADILVYGSGEHAVAEIAARIDRKEALDGIAGTLAIMKTPPDAALLLPPEAESMQSLELFAESFALQYRNQHRILAQCSGGRYLVQYPPHAMTGDELDAVHALPFTRMPAPRYAREKIPAFEMIRLSINAHRGCASGCAFCSLAMHQGRRIVSRSEASCVDEARRLKALPYFKGHITDVGGPSANMYGTRCKASWRCSRESCIHPARCPNLVTDHQRWLKLIRRVAALEGVNHVTVGSGIRYDLMHHDAPETLDALMQGHISGQLKIAPEHLDDAVLDVMRKRPLVSFEKFAAHFSHVAQRHGLKRFLIPYLMSNHPGSTMDAMRRMRSRIKTLLGYVPDQVQSFIPLPGTLSGVIYCTGIDPLTGEKVFSEKSREAKRRQHDIFFSGKH